MLHAQSVGCKPAPLGTKSKTRSLSYVGAKTKEPAGKNEISKIRGRVREVPDIADRLASTPGQNIQIVRCM